jgi:predicted ATPase/DNA-binding CsgD family transcriptional regulator
MPATGRATSGNLPAEVTSFVGRPRELRQVKQRLVESRLVTLTGVGGTGKTRLAVRVAAEVRRAFGDGAWFVDLTELNGSRLLVQEFHDPDMLALLVTTALGLREQGNEPPLRALAGQLADRQMLLVLDNCEHVLPACALLVDGLLHGCPDLRILATSREPLTIAGESLAVVPALPAPDPHQRPGLAEMSRYESVALFVARAGEAVPGFALTEDNRDAVAELCRRLDGLPLAIELAASRVRALAPQQILERLTDRFRLLGSGRRTLPARQQTLRGCIDWSFDLCPKPERTLWARLSVFAGGFELDAIEGICADEQLPEADLLDLVASLMDKSILVRDGVRDERSPTARYRMLETIRCYGGEALREAGEDVVLRRRHRDWYQGLLDQACAVGITDQHGYWLARLGRELPNLRAALEFCLTEPGEAEAALLLPVSVPRPYWRARGLFGEGRRWLDSALGQATAPSALRARALMVNSHLAFLQGDRAAAVRLLDRAEELARHVDAAAAFVYADFLRGMAALWADDAPAAVEAFNRAWVTLSEAPDLNPEPSLDLRLSVLLTLGTAAARAGYLEWAGDLVRELLAMVEPRGDGLDRSLVLWVGGYADWLRGDLRQAAEQDLESVRIKQACEADDRYGMALCLELLSWITADQRRHSRAATLLGVANALWTDVGSAITSYPHLVGHHDACERQIRDALGEAAFADAFGHGRGLARDDMLAYALEERRAAAPPPREEAPNPLTRREQQVADLIAQGLSNKDIAAALLISQRTAESHVEHVLSKLGFTSRAQVAAWIAGATG